jgi:hypothetical protein
VGEVGKGTKPDPMLTDKQTATLPGCCLTLACRMLHQKKASFSLICHGQELTSSVRLQTKILISSVLKGVNAYALLL